MKYPLGALLSALSLNAVGSSYLTVNKDIYGKIEQGLPSQLEIARTQDTVILRNEGKLAEKLSNLIHHNLKRCGGFMVHDQLQKALESSKKKPIQLPLIDYSIDQEQSVEQMLGLLQERRIRDMVLALTAFGTRHYLSSEASDAVKFISSSWKKLSAHRSDVSVEEIKHRGFPQKSIVLTIKGSETPDEIVVIGGHSDSISDEHFAPGADDNASGIATITEVLRVMMETDFKPKKTIQLMAYAAEEVGLFGSQELALQYKKNKRKVIGVMQLDMTLYKGSADKDIYLISDYTNKQQNAFLGRLIDKYVHVPWGYSACGYACSDHASWTAQGYPASYAFESTFEDSSPYIHTRSDTLESHGGNASHAFKFSQLATAFVVELSN